MKSADFLFSVGCLLYVRASLAPSLVGMRVKLKGWWWDMKRIYLEVPLKCRLTCKYLVLSIISRLSSCRHVSWYIRPWPVSNSNTGSPLRSNFSSWLEKESSVFLRDKNNRQVHSIQEGSNSFLAGIKFFLASHSLSHWDLNSRALVALALSALTCSIWCGTALRAWRCPRHLNSNNVSMLINTSQLAEYSLGNVWSSC